MDTIRIERDKYSNLYDQYELIESERDALQIQKQQVKYVFKPQYIYVGAATDDELDSIIRTNWE